MTDPAVSLPTLADAKKAFDSGDMREAERIADEIARYGSSVPAVTQALHFAGIVRLEQNRAREACALIRKAVLLDPSRASAIANLAQAAGAGDRLDIKALAHRAVQANPRSALCLSVLAALYKEHARKERARRQFELALEHSKRALVLLPDLAEALRGAVTERRWQAILTDIDGVLDRAAGVLELVKQTPPPPISVVGGYASAETQLFAARGVLARLPDPAPRPFLRTRPRARIHIAYVGSYLKAHALASALPEIFQRHDRSRFRVNVYATPRPEGATEWNPAIEASADSLIDISNLDPTAQADTLRRNDEHIAVDLDGYLGEPLELFCHAPAPILVNYFGFPGTCGGLHDYIVADRVLVPAGMGAFYGESIVRLPHSYIPFDRDQATALTPTRADCGLPEESFVLAALHSQNKTAADAFDSWLSCLRRIPDSVLWLLDHGETNRTNITQAALRGGIDPSRLIFAPLVPHPKHMARLPLADLYIDNTWFNAHTTAVDALWMGLPVVSCAGTAFAARVGASVLHAAGLPDLIGNDRHEMADIAVSLARAPARLTAVRSQLRGAGRAAPLFDMTRYTRDLERSFEAMAERSRAGLPPADITLSP